MRAFFILFGGVVAIASIVCAVMTMAGKLDSSVGLILLLIAIALINVGKRQK